MDEWLRRVAGVHVGVRARLRGVRRMIGMAGGMARTFVPLVISSHATYISSLHFS